MTLFVAYISTNLLLPSHSWKLSRLLSDLDPIFHIVSFHLHCRNVFRLYWQLLAMGERRSGRTSSCERGSHCCWSKYRLLSRLSPSEWSVFSSWFIQPCPYLSLTYSYLLSRLLHPASSNTSDPSYQPTICLLITPTKIPTLSLLKTRMPSHGIIQRTGQRLTIMSRRRVCILQVQSINSTKVNQPNGHMALVRTFNKDTVQ